ncbi:MAG: class I SAM-dependent methyltransferase [Archangiaceae bacterium]|nr:class I SAM-dependent methyltransferase [Archangiaceae bacterium]
MHVVQCSAFAPAFAEQTFDYVYSFGVIHHTYSTKAAFDQVSRLPKVGGRLYIWVYSPYDEARSPIRKALMMLENATRPLISRLPDRAQTAALVPFVPLYMGFQAVRRVTSRNQAQVSAVRARRCTQRDRFSPGTFTGTPRTRSSPGSARPVTSSWWRARAAAPRLRARAFWACTGVEGVRRDRGGSRGRAHPRRVRAPREVDAVGLYALTHRPNLFAHHGRERELRELLDGLGLLPLGGRSLLEVGCGEGEWFATFERFGLELSKLAGIDLDEGRLARARERAPKADLRCGDATKLPWGDRTFDLIFQSTVFSSVLAAPVREALAREMVRVLKPGGVVLWYDFAWNNPSNPNVRGNEAVRDRAAVSRGAAGDPQGHAGASGRAQAGSGVVACVRAARAHGAAQHPPTRGDSPVRRSLRALLSARAVSGARPTAAR